MLPFRILHLLVVGLCLLLIAKYMQLLYATVRWFDRLMMKPFFDVEGLTNEIRTIAARRRNMPDPSAREVPPFAANRCYRWLCRRLLRVTGLDRVKAQHSD